VDPVRLETGVEAVAIGAGAEPVGVDIPEEPDEPLVVKADNKLNMSTATLLTSFCSPDVAAIVGVDAVKLGAGVEATDVMESGAELVVVVVAADPDELPAVEADTKPKRSFTTLLTSFCRLDVVPLAVVEPPVSSALE
jgi:hypothetical protein